MDKKNVFRFETKEGLKVELQADDLSLIFDNDLVNKLLKEELEPKNQQVNQAQNNVMPQQSQRQQMSRVNYEREQQSVKMPVGASNGRPLMPKTKVTNYLDIQPNQMSENIWVTLTPEQQSTWQQRYLGNQ